MSRVGPVSGNPPPQNLWVGPFDPRLFAGASGRVGNANYARLTVFQVSRPVTVTIASISPTVQNGNVDVGIYSYSGTRLGSTGSTACPATGGVRSIALTAPVSLAPGVSYWAAFATDSATCAIIAMPPGGGPISPIQAGISCYINPTAFPLPGSVTPLANADSFAPFVMFT